MLGLNWSQTDRPWIENTSRTNNKKVKGDNNTYNTDEKFFV